MSSSMFNLVGDVGGTNARFALLEPGSLQPVNIEKLQTAGFDCFEDALAAYLKAHGSPPIAQAVIAIATPVDGDFLDVTNNHWAFSISEVSRRLSLDSLHFVNDFTALAHSLPYLEPADLQLLGAPALLDREAKGLIGPGTGLGVSGLVPAQTDWIALRGEGGHTSFAASNDREFALLRYLQTLYGHVSSERVLSGPGIEATYLALAALDNVQVEPLRAAEITARALSDRDEHCVETIQIFCDQLASRAADLSLILGSIGGLYIGGGIVPRLGSLFDPVSFRHKFENKGRMSALLRKIPLAVIRAEYASLTGAARLLEKRVKAAGA